MVLVGLEGVKGVDGYNFTDDFSDSSKIGSMNRLNLNTNITLSSNVNDLNDTNYLLLYSELGSDNEILSPVIGHAGDPLYYYSFNDTKHYDSDSTMIGWWNFTANANDSSGNGNHGVVTGAIHNGEHYEFNGTTDYIKVDYNESLNVTNITVAAWVKINSSKATHTVVGRHFDNWEISITSNGANVMLYKSDGAGSYETHSGSNALFGDEDWHHLGWTFNSSDNKSIFYIDGSFLSSKIMGSNSIYNDAVDLYIGKRNGGVNDLSGSIDEVAIYNRTLNSSEILTQYKKTARNVSNINYTTGLIGNGSYLNASTELTFSGNDFYAPKGAISFSASLPNWSVTDSQYFFYTSDNSGNYIKIVKVSAGIYLYFVEDGNAGWAVISSDAVTGFSNDSWHNFTFTWDIDSDFMAYYIDNEHYEVDGYTSGNTNPTYAGGWSDKSDWENIFTNFNPTTLYIGRSSGTGHELNGTIDELRILNETYEPTSYSSRKIVLESIAFDTGVSDPTFGNISWIENLPDKTDIEFQISVSSDNITWINWTGLSKGLVTLTFDDGLLSQYTNASTNMTPYGYKGTAYIISDDVGGSNFMNSTQLLELQDSGWEIGGHSKTHNASIWYTLSDSTRSQLITEINDSYQNLTDLGLVQKHFCYPGGSYDLNVLDIVSDYYITARTTEEGYNTYDRKYRLKRKDGSVGVSSVQTYIDTVANGSSWLILMFHNVGAIGSGWINLSDFNEILSYLNSSNVDVVTIDEALGNLSSYTNYLGEQITAPSKRYIKYRAMLHSYNGSITPTLDNVKIEYLNANITFSEFDGSTTNLFNIVNLSNITNFIIEKSSYGKINFTDNVNLSGGGNLNTHVNISYNRIEINSTALPALNKSATLILYNLTFTNPRVLRDGAVCPSSICTEVSYVGSNFTFTVTSFSVYSAGETPTTTTSNAGGGGYATFKLNQKQLEKSYEKSLRKGWKIEFVFNNEIHTIKLENIIGKTAIITVSSEPITFNLAINETKKLNLDNDNCYDLKVFLKDVSRYEADLVVKLIHEEIPIGEKKIEEKKESSEKKIEEKKESSEKKIEEKSKLWLWIVLDLVVIIALIFVVIYKSKKR